MSQLSEEDRAELVAYLDGELDEEAAQALEARMSRDQELRAEADAMKKTWEMLDFLPRAEPSASFTHRTLERLAVQDTSRLMASKKPRRWPWVAPVGWAAAVLVAVLGGLYAAPLVWQPARPTQAADIEAAIARDKEVIREKRLLENGENISFARKLAEIFDEEDGE